MQSTSYLDLKEGGNSIVLPHNREAEEALLGAVIQNSSVLDPTEIASLDYDGFFIKRNGLIWEAIIRLVEQGRPVEYLTIIEELDDKLSDVGGESYLTSLLNKASSSFHAPEYLRLVKEAATRRRVYMTGHQLVKSTMNGTDPATAIVDAEEMLSSLRLGVGSGMTILSSDELLSKYLDQPEEDRWIVDRLIGDGLNLIAGDFGSGKSWIGPDTGIAIVHKQLALQRQTTGGKVLYCGFDMDAVEFGRRLNRLMLGRGLSGTPTDLDWNFDRIRMSEPADRIRFENTIREKSYDVCIMDSANKYMGDWDEKDNRDVADFLASLREIKNRTDCNFLLLHFLRKLGTNVSLDRLADRIRGAGDWLGGVDSALVLIKSGHGLTLNRQLIQVKLRGNVEAASLNIGIDDTEDGSGTMVTCDVANPSEVSDKIGAIHAGIVAAYLEKNPSEVLDKHSIKEVVEEATNQKVSESAMKEATNVLKNIKAVRVWRGEGSGRPNQFAWRGQ